MPGPTSTASTRDDGWPAARRAAGRCPPASVSGSPTTSASGTASPRCGATLRQVAICSLPAPARSAAIAGEQGGARHLDAAADDEHAPALVLVAVLAGSRQRHAAQELGRDRRRATELLAAHRVATMASGSEVTGAPASSSGATKL